MVKDNPEQKWESQNLGIKNLVYCTYDFVVFINTEIECDWKTSDEYDEIIKHHKKALSQIQTRAKHLESQANESLSKEKAEEYKVLICDSMSSALQLEFDNANEALENVHKRLAKEWSKNYRIAQIVTSLIYVLITYILINILVVIDFKLPTMASIEGYMWYMFGMLGATISLIIRNSEITYESSSNLYLHITESIAKLTVGGVFGCIAIFGVKSGLLLSFLTKDGSSPNVIYFVAFCFGFSEKLIPLLTKPLEKE